MGNKYNRLPIGEGLDIAGRSGVNGIFGGSLTLTRVAHFASNFSYGIDTRKASDLSANGGSFGFDTNLIKVSSGTSANGVGRIETKRHLRYTAGKDAEIMGTVIFATPVENNRQLAGLFDDSNGFMIGYEGLDFSIFRKRDGVIVETVNQANFNVDKLDGEGKSGFDINPNNINLYRIVYGYLGIATVYYEVYDGSKFIPFHKIQLTNTIAETHILNPYLPIRIESENFGNITNIEIRSGSIYAGILDGGGSEVSARRFALKRDDIAITAGTDLRLAVFHNKPVFNGIENNIEDLLHTVGLGVQSNKPVIISMYKLATPPTGGTWTDKDTNNSNMEYSIDTVISLTNADLLAVWVLGETGYENVDVSSSRHLLFPDEYASVVYSAGTGSNGFLSYGIQWDELF